ncbi:other/FunK1 protein kinase [Coprinopsis cinerea AmutBmut pab1-1]|nr:other/FunK1 protein kinase [Coprinopsis cinerea AmutBmut pab1-1]
MSNKEYFMPGGRTFDRSLYKDVASKQEINTYLTQSPYYDTKTKRWSLPNFCTSGSNFSDSGVKELRVRVASIVEDIKSYFWHERSSSKTPVPSFIWSGPEDDDEGEYAKTAMLECHWEAIHDSEKRMDATYEDAAFTTREHIRLEKRVLYVSSLLHLHRPYRPNETYSQIHNVLFKAPHSKPSRTDSSSVYS